MGIHVRSNKLMFIIDSDIRRSLGNNNLIAEILAVPTQTPTIPKITQYTFNPQLDVALIGDLRSSVVYNVRFFTMEGSSLSERRYFVNTLIKTGMPFDTAFCKSCPENVLPSPIALENLAV